MDKIVLFFIVFIVVYLLYFFTVVLNKKKRKKIFSTSQARLIIIPNKLDTDRINKSVFIQILSLSNSFIVAFTFMVSEFFDNYFIKLIVCFFVLIILIYFIYKFIGYIYKKREGR